MGGVYANGDESMNPFALFSIVAAGVLFANWVPSQVAGSFLYWPLKDRGRSSRGAAPDVETFKK